MQQLVRHPIVLFVISFALMSIAARLGSRTLRSRIQIDEDARDDFKIVQSATLTLLALVIGFGLSMAVGRYDQRKNLEEEEANAIGTEFIRADLLAEGEAAMIRSLLVQHLALRGCGVWPFIEQALQLHPRLIIDPKVNSHTRSVGGSHANGTTLPL
ncbi:hypothetical protein B0G71_3037 [Paraburkholderia sp. BL27I4N3]|uniref:hypothetical protein n=1 Tax=Paraburkholderia sp. BL27I4N3 TaxID=1938805 RepID=UPI000E3B44DA|nr:hypothetical protein [Paraburkholderia sp. BL27I4N3]REE19920.1 hypothetical protein B0G71_3037 [Paraburkholderia sp. BL27I4N3]